MIDNNLTHEADISCISLRTIDQSNRPFEHAIMRPLRMLGKNRKFDLDLAYKRICIMISNSTFDTDWLRNLSKFYSGNKNIIKRSFE